MIQILRMEDDKMKYKKIIWSLMILSFIGTLAIFPHLPEHIPIHWNMHGEIDNYSSKYIALFLAVLPALIYLMMTYLPKIDPKKESYQKHSKAYSIISATLAVFTILIHWVSLLAALNIIRQTDFFVKLLVGILFVILGNYMTQLRYNYFIGIRLPWTLASETVWRKTHRVGGIAMMLLGLILVLTSFIRGSISAVIFGVSLFSFIFFTFLYAYLEYKKEIKGKS